MFQLSMVGVLLTYIIRRARRELNKTVQELDVKSPASESASEDDLDKTEKGQMKGHGVNITVHNGYNLNRHRNNSTSEHSIS